MKRSLLFLTLLFLGISVSLAQKKEKQYNIRTIAFYNLENLFDTINDTSINDEASPMMELKSNKSKVYWDSLRFSRQTRN